MKSIILSVSNDLVTDQRVHRVAQTLMENGARVTVIGRQSPVSLPLERKYSIHRMWLIFTKGPLFYAELNIRLFFYLLFHKADILVANDLDTLLANYLVSVIRRKPLVYDSHEYFTGIPEVQNRKIVYMVWKAIERFIFPKLKHIYTVNNSIANLYENEYGKPIAVVRNMPVRISKDKWPDKTELGLPEDKNIIILQGAGINIHRGAEEAVEAMRFMDNSLLLIIGSGDVFKKLQEMAVVNQLDSKIIFKPKMPYEKLMNYTRHANIGLSLDKDTNLNYKYSLPNKLFDYIQAGVPVLCSNLVEVANILNFWQIGVIAESHDPKYLAEKMQAMLSNRDQQYQWKQNLSIAAEELCWEKEKRKLLEVFDKLL